MKAAAELSYGSDHNALRTAKAGIGCGELTKEKTRLRGPFQGTAEA